MAVATEQLDRSLQSSASVDIRRICFVCTGNTCRSPMAAAVANAQAQKTGQALLAFSAGLYAVEGMPISSNAVLALENAEIAPAKGLDYHSHVAHTLTEAEAAGFDLLIPMTRAHAMELILRYPQVASKIYCLPTEISDPYGGDLRVYEKCLSEIAEGVCSLLNREV